MCEGSFVILQAFWVPPPLPVRLSQECGCGFSHTDLSVKKVFQGQMTSRRFFHELSFKILLSEKEKKIPFSKRKSIIRDHLCCLHGACPTSPQSATPSETELNGGCHHVWSEGCRDACQRPRLSHNPIVLTGFFFLTFYGIVHGESEKTVKQVA